MMYLYIYVSSCLYTSLLSYAVSGFDILFLSSFILQCLYVCTSNCIQRGSLRTMSLSHRYIRVSARLQVVSLVSMSQAVPANVLY